MVKMGRRPWYDKNGMKKGAWSKEEDHKLTSYIQKHGHSNWRQLPKFAGLSRCGKSCRLRWLNYLRQNIKRGNFSKEEEDLIMKLRDEHGNKWADIATKLPAGRTDNEIKNYWHSKLKKRGEPNSTSKIMRQPCENPLLEENKKELAQEKVVDHVSSQQTSEGCSNFSESSSNGPSNFDFDYALFSEINWSPEENISSMESYYEPIENFWTEPFQPEKTCDQFCDQILMQELPWYHIP